MIKQLLSVFIVCITTIILVFYINHGSPVSLADIIPGASPYQSLGYRIAAVFCIAVTIKGILS